MRRRVDVDGARLDLTIEPRDDESLAHSVAALAERGIGSVVRGGGTRLGFGNAPRGARALLSTRRLAGIVEIDAEDGVAHVRAGTPLGELRDAVAAAGWVLPFDAPGARTTLGGVLATAAIGPRASADSVARAISCSASTWCSATARELAAADGSSRTSPATT